MSKSRKIADLAILIAIGVVLNLATLPRVEFFGTISFVYGFCYLSGVFLGPYLGFVAAAAADGLGWLLQPTGPYVWQLMLTNGIMAFLAGFFYKNLKWKNEALRIIPAASISFVFLTLGLTAWGESQMLFNVFPYTFAKSIGAALNISSPYLMIAISKAATQPFWIIINIVLSAIVLKRISIARKQFISSLETFREEVSGSKKEG